MIAFVSCLVFPVGTEGISVQSFHLGRADRETHSRPFYHRIVGGRKAANLETTSLEEATAMSALDAGTTDWKLSREAPAL